ncbi:MAG: type II 3-dehydroquinate dehydratase [Thermodesulfobacteriota bacterium]
MQSKKSNKRLSVLVIHGPNINMLGKREPEIYGHATLAEINARLIELGKGLNIAVETFQSNHEGDIVDRIQTAENHSGLIINPAAYTHTSIAIRDALLALKIPMIEIHLSNIDKRETFRHTSMIADIVTARITGLGPRGYITALEALARILLEEGPKQPKKTGAG